jgi:hypothetical protein
MGGLSSALSISRSAQLPLGEVLLLAAGGWVELELLVPALVEAPVSPLEPERCRLCLWALLEVSELSAELSLVLGVVAVAVP